MPIIRYGAADPLPAALAFIGQCTFTTHPPAQIVRFAHLVQFVPFRVTNIPVSGNYGNTKWWRRMRFLRSGRRFCSLSHRYQLGLQLGQLRSVLNDHLLPRLDVPV